MNMTTTDEIFYNLQGETHSEINGGGSDTSIMNTIGKHSDKLLSGLSIIFFTLAILYVFSDFNTILDINEYATEWKIPIKFSLGYVSAYLRILLKSLLVLFFIYVFIIIYNIVLIGVFKPLVSDGIDSTETISKFAGINDIIIASKSSYFKPIAIVAQKMMSIAFGFLILQYSILILLFIVPIIIFIVSLVYYSTISKKSNIPEEKMQDVLKTNYHFMSMFILLLLFVVFTYLIYSSLIS
jgi:hypothetical protein